MITSCLCRFSRDDYRIKLKWYYQYCTMYRAGLLTFKHIKQLYNSDLQQGRLVLDSIFVFSFPYLNQIN